MYIIIVINIVNGIRTNTMMFLKNFDISFLMLVIDIKNDGIKNKPNRAICILKSQSNTFTLSSNKVTAVDMIIVNPIFNIK